MPTANFFLKWSNQLTKLKDQKTWKTYWKILKWANPESQRCYSFGLILGVKYEFRYHKWAFCCKLNPTYLQISQNRNSIQNFKLKNIMTGYKKLCTQHTNVCEKYAVYPKVLYASIVCFYFLSFTLTLLSSFVENYFVFFFIYPHLLAWMSKTYLIVLLIFLQTWPNFMVNFTLRVSKLYHII